MNRAFVVAFATVALMNAILLVLEGISSVRLSAFSGWTAAFIMSAYRWNK